MRILKTKLISSRILKATALKSFAFLLAATFAVEAGQSVTSLSVRGNKRIEAETVRALLRPSADGTYSEQNLNASLKSLYDSGHFKNVDVDIKGKTLVVTVEENPSINRVGYEGNDDIDYDLLKTEVDLQPRQPLTKASLKRAVNKIKRIYRQKGFFVANVVPKIVKLPENRVDVVFEIEEGTKTKVGRIFFIGNNAISAGDLEAVIQTKQSRWYRFFSNDDNYDPDRVGYDRELLRQYYLTKGYADFRVKSSVAELSQDKKEFFITFTVDEGERYDFGEIKVTSKLADIDIDRLRSELTMSKGQIFNNKEIEKSVDAIAAAVGEKGYAFVDVNPRIVKDAKTRTISVNFELSEGPKVYIEKITIVGNTRTDEDVIRREMRLHEGDAFNTEKMKRSERRIKNLGYFKDIKIVREAGSYPDRVNIRIEIEEDKTGEISVSAGYSTQDGIIGDVKYTERNFRGRGQTLSVGAVLSGRRKEGTISFTEPYLFGMELAGGIDLFTTSSTSFFDQTFTHKQTGGSVRFGYELAQDLIHQVYYTLRQDRISGVAATAAQSLQEQAGTAILSEWGQTLTYDRRDTRINTTKGWMVGVSNSHAGLGGDIKYLKNSIFGAYYYPVRENWVLELKATYSFMVSLGKAFRVVDRYTLGGDSLRGFEVSGVGPRASGGLFEPLGGRQSFSATAEMTFPIGLPNEFGVKGAAFIDVGSVWDPGTLTTPFNDSNKIRGSVGAGIRWRSPFGPIKIDLAYAFSKAAFDKTQPLLFGMTTRF